MLAVEIRWVLKMVPELVEVPVRDRDLDITEPGVDPDDSDETGSSRFSVG